MKGGDLANAGQKQRALSWALAVCLQHCPEIYSESPKHRLSTCQEDEPSAPQGGLTPPALQSLQESNSKLGVIFTSTLPSLVF